MDDTNSGAAQSRTEVAVFDVGGKETKVHAAELSHAIEVRMEDGNLTFAQAWEAVQEDLAASLNGRRVLPASPRPRQQPALFPIGPQDVVVGSITAGEGDEPEKAEPAEEPVAPVVAAPASVFRPASFLEQMEARHARKDKGKVPIMHALANGSLQDDGAHPHAELFRQVQAEDPILDRLDPSRVANREAATQLNLRFPQSPLGWSVFPSDFCRTSIFHVASNNVARRECKEELMGQLGSNLCLIYDGTELRHDDERVLMQLIQLAQHRMPWAWIEINTLAFARSASGTTRKVLGQTDSESVEDALKRMRHGIVTVVKDKNFVTINLLRELQGAGSRRMIQLDPRIVLLFGSYISFDDKTYHATRGIERQLFKYLHTNPYEETYPIKVQTLFELCYGNVNALQAAYLKDNPAKSEKDARRAIVTKKMSDFRKKGLPAALEALKKKEVVAEIDLVEDEDKVVIRKGKMFAERNAAPAEAP